MAESVKRRVAAARLAVAFVAAGTIAGASAWAQAGPPPTAHSSILISSHKLKIDSANIKNGSLLLQDFKAGEIASQDSFFKFKSQVSSFKYDVKSQLSSIKGELGGVETQIGDVKTAVSGIKGELGSYIKSEQADARYLKLSDSIVRGDGSVFTATKLVVGQSPVPLLSVPGLITVDAFDGEQEIKITNVGAGDLSFSACDQYSSGGTLKPGGSVSCSAGAETDVMQLISAGGEVTTLNFTALPAVQSNYRVYTVQVLIGL